MPVESKKRIGVATPWLLLNMRSAFCSTVPENYFFSHDMQNEKDAIRYYDQNLSIFLRELLQVAKDEGYKIALLSSAVTPVLGAYEQRIKPDKIFLFQTLDMSMPRQGLAELIEDVGSAQHAINMINESEHTIDKTVSVAIGNTEKDMSLFASTIWPICLNPEPLLKKAASEEGYPFIIEVNGSLWYLNTDKSFHQREEPRYSSVRLGPDIIPPKLVEPLVKRLEKI